MLSEDRIFFQPKLLVITVLFLLKQQTKLFLLLKMFPIYGVRSSGVETEGSEFSASFQFPIS